MRINVVPTKSVSEVEFGMNRDRVRAILGDAIEFFKFEDDINSTDDFGFCHVFYDKDNKCEAVEVFNDVEVFLNDTLFFPTDFTTAKIMIPDFEQDEDGLISYSQSI